MPNRSKQKGTRFELDCVHKAQTLGLSAFRYPTSASPQNQTWDISIAGKQCQCKKEASGFKRIQQWLIGVDALIVGADYSEPLVVLKLQDWLKLL